MTMFSPVARINVDHHSAGRQSALRIFTSLGSALAQHRGNAVSSTEECAARWPIDEDRHGTWP
jgi:hypothetical protein